MRSVPVGGVTSRNIFDRVMRERSLSLGRPARTQPNAPGRVAVRRTRIVDRTNRRRCRRWEHNSPDGGRLFESLMRAGRPLHVHVVGPVHYHLCGFAASAYSLGRSWTPVGSRCRSAGTWRAREEHERREQPAERIPRRRCSDPDRCRTGPGAQGLSSSLGAVRAAARAWSEECGRVAPLTCRRRLCAGDVAGARRHFHKGGES